MRLAEQPRWGRIRLTFLAVLTVHPGTSNPLSSPPGDCDSCRLEAAGRESALPRVALASYTRASRRV